MAALAKTDWTVTIGQRDRDQLTRFRKCFATLKIGDAVKTYPANGIPLPDKEQFGLHKYVRFVNTMPPIDGYVYKVDKANWKLLIYYGDYDPAAAAALVEIPDSTAPAEFTIELEITGE